MPLPIRGGARIWTQAVGSQRLLPNHCPSPSQGERCPPRNLPRGKRKEREAAEVQASNPHSLLLPHLLLSAKGFCLSAALIFGCRKKVAAIHTCRTMRPRTMAMVRLKHRVRQS